MMTKDDVARVYSAAQESIIARAHRVNGPTRDLAALYEAARAAYPSAHREIFADDWNWNRPAVGAP